MIEQCSELLRIPDFDRSIVPTLWMPGNINAIGNENAGLICCNIVHDFGQKFSFEKIQSQ
ncbi:hypothetical protein DERF_015807 [Dermatophagoides farinae]|uniref:Uncharacterized protein n=1 Tax=Dermatophagoides farinae TaxID=6954 RepID=A0A922HF82_DERFA|nr:hypothetical protein DERF_015807 [Dermatophagoides farinae]